MFTLLLFLAIVGYVFMGCCGVMADQYKVFTTYLLYSALSLVMATALTIVGLLTGTF